MAANTNTDHHSHASWKQLSTVFTVALLLFVVLRIQPEPWISAQIDKQSTLHGLNMHYDSLKLDGLTIHVDQLTIQSNRLMAPVKLNSLSLSPAWSSLLSGTAGANIQTNWNGQQLSAVISQKADIIDIQSLNGELDMVSLQPFITKNLPIPLKVGGKAQITGDIQLNAINGHPRLGKIQLLWSKAGIDMSSMKIPLGDYALILQTDDVKRAWQWDLNGGTALKLSGKGNLNTSAQNPAAWSINGMIQAQVDPKSTNLSALLGTNKKQFKISGNITQPRLQPL